MLTPGQLKTLKEAATPWPAEKPKIKASRSRWFHRVHQEVFQQLFKEFPNGTYLELGTWTGMGSTRYVLDHYPGMKVIAIDTFKGSPEHQRKEDWKKIADSLWQHFCVNIWQHHHRVFPFRMTTVNGMEAVAATGVQPDIVYIDAAHDEASVYNDIETALKCFPKAVIVGDDFVPANVAGHPGVRLGVERAIAAGLIEPDEFHHRQRVWYLSRNRKDIDARSQAKEAAPYKGKKLLLRSELKKNSRSEIASQRIKPSRNSMEFDPESVPAGVRKQVTADVVLPYCESNLEFVRDAVESVLNQNDAKVIVHLISDGVPDTFDNVRLRFADLPNVRTYYNEKSGPYIATNRVFQFLETEYMVVMDSDDISMPQRVWRSIMAMEYANCDAYGGTMEQFVDYRYSNPDLVSRLQREPTAFSGGPNNILIHGAQTTRVAAFRELNGYKDNICGSDWHFHRRMIHAGMRVYYSDHIVCLRRLHSASLTNGPEWASGGENRKVINKSNSEDYQAMNAGADPRKFGNLDRHLKSKLITRTN